MIWRVFYRRIGGLLRSVKYGRAVDKNSTSGKVHNQNGFSVLEAMIAMAILAAALLPLLALQGQFVKSVDSFARIDTRLTARASSIHYLKSLNLSQAKTGRYIHSGASYGVDKAAVEIRWVAVPALEERRARTIGGAGGRFVMVLYTVNVEIWTVNATIPVKLDQFEMRGLGWRATRGLLEGI